MDFAAILQMAVTYGPGAVTAVENIVKKLEAGAQPTVSDVELEFSGLQTYDSYGIKQAS